MMKKKNEKLILNTYDIKKEEEELYNLSVTDFLDRNSKFINIFIYSGKDIYQINNLKVYKFCNDLRKNIHSITDNNIKKKTVYDNISSYFYDILTEINNLIDDKLNDDDIKNLISCLLISLFQLSSAPLGVYLLPIYLTTGLQKVDNYYINVIIDFNKKLVYKIRKMIFIKHTDYSNNDGSSESMIYMNEIIKKYDDICKYDNSDCYNILEIYNMNEGNNTVEQNIYELVKLNDVDGKLLIINTLYSPQLNYMSAWNKHDIKDKLKKLFNNNKYNEFIDVINSVDSVDDNKFKKLEDSNKLYVNNYYSINKSIMDNNVDNTNIEKKLNINDYYYIKFNLNDMETDINFDIHNDINKEIKTIKKKYIKSKEKNKEIEINKRYEIYKNSKNNIIDKYLDDYAIDISLLSKYYIILRYKNDDEYIEDYIPNGDYFINLYNRLYGEIKPNDILNQENKYDIIKKELKICWGKIIIELKKISNEKYKNKLDKYLTIDNVNFLIPFFSNFYLVKDILEKVLNTKLNSNKLYTALSYYIIIDVENDIIIKNNYYISDDNKYICEANICMKLLDDENIYI
jgi:hypothetical protein